MKRMYQYLLLFVFLLFFGLLSNTLHSQLNIDSLRRIISIESNSSGDKAKAANQISTYYLSDNQDSTSKYISIAKNFASLANDERELLYADISYGALFSASWSKDSTLNYYKSILNEMEKEKYPELVSMAYINIGRALSYYGDFQQSISYLLQALELQEKINNEVEIAKIKYNLGVVYYNNNQYELAIDRFKEALLIYQKLNNKVLEAYCLNGIANTLIYTDQGNLAKPYLEKLISIADSTKNVVLQAVSRTALAGLKADSEEYKEALKLYTESIPYMEKYGNELLLANSFCNIASAYFKLNNLQLAKEFIDKAYTFEILEDNTMADELCLYSKALIYEKIGEYQKASSFFIDYIEYQDSVLLSENKLVIAELEEKYESTKKEAEIQKQALEIEKRTNQRNLFVTGFSLTTLLGGSLIWGIFSRMRRNKKIAIQAQHLQTQKIQALEQDKKLLTLASKLEGQETERVRIAKELHDGLGGLLMTVKVHFGKIKDEIKKIEELDIYQSAYGMINKAHDEVRRISHNLMPSDLRVGGISLALQQLVHEMKYVHEVSTTLEMNGMEETVLDENIELIIYRIVQELLNNIVKYAKADHVIVQINKFENEIQLLVEDDGTGFNYEEALLQNGLGLKSINSRVRQVNGIIDVRSDKEGTSVSINIPL